jgi:hypothetical protein
MQRAETRIIQVGWNKVAQIVAGTAQPIFPVFNGLSQKTIGFRDRSSGNDFGCLFQPTVHE